jgi:hypothetical protein
MRIGIATDHGGFSLRRTCLDSSAQRDMRSSILGLITLARAMTILIMWSRWRGPWPRGRWIVV